MSETIDKKDSILLSIKKLLGIAEDQVEYEQPFDTDIIIHINSILSSLVQLGIGPESGYSINSISEKWSDFLGQNNPKQQMVVTYVYLKVRLLFDPPASSVIAQAINEQIKELEWRLSITVD